jgi:hypothetical protein
MFKDTMFTWSHIKHDYIFQVDIFYISFVLQPISLLNVSKETFSRHTFIQSYILQVDLLTFPSVVLTFYKLIYWLFPSSVLHFTSWSTDCSLCQSYILQVDLLIVPFVSLTFYKLIYWLFPRRPFLGICFLGFTADKPFDFTISSTYGILSPFCYKSNNISISWQCLTKSVT